jgi:nucleotide-binding universal stress UspA family protein
MIPFRRILFPVDYSEWCNALVPYVKDMVRRFSGELTLVHAYGIEYSSYSGRTLTDSVVFDEAESVEDQRLRQYAIETFPGQHIECLVKLGEPASVIESILQHQGTDLVMLPTHGRGPIRRFLLGSITAKVLHDVTAAVWTVAGSSLVNHRPALPYRSILCALDDSDEAEAVLKASAVFARAYDARLSLVQVVESPPPSLDIDVNRYKKDLIEAAQFRIRELKGNVGVDATDAILDAMATEGVLQEACRQKADIIITGRGRVQTRISRMWSHLYRLVRESPCPVLSI